MERFKLLLRNFPARLKYYYYEGLSLWRLGRITRQVAKQAKPNPDQQPVIFFNASTRIISTSLNAGFSALSAWGLRLAGVPVKHFVCNAGMRRCVLETKFSAPTYEPACQKCTAQSRRIYAGADVEYFEFSEERELAKILAPLSIKELTKVVYQDIPLGELVLPSFRWALRRQYLPDDVNTHFLLSQFILSAYNVAQNFEKLLNESDPSLVVVFNGQMYPEATARYLAQKNGVPVVTHEVSFQPLAGFFTHGRATAFPIEIPKSFKLDERQNATLDAYLEKRFQGKFTMAGIQFWPEMKELSPEITKKIEEYDQIVPIFTNVIFDTSQPHANTVFEHMFAWLDLVLEKIKKHPSTLFIVRAHPDEQREGKQSVDSVRKWATENKIDLLPNVIFIDSQEFVSSYDLIRRAKFVVVYNSSIALEATLLGAAVLCGGRSRFTDYETMFFPQSVSEYSNLIDKFIKLENIEVNRTFLLNARRFLYYQNWHTPLPFDEFLDEHKLQGYVRFRNFNVEKLHPHRNGTMKRIYNGFFGKKNFTI